MTASGEPSATQGGTERGNGTTMGGYTKGDSSGFNLPRRPYYAERRVLQEPHLYVSQLNNPTLALGSNYGGQNGDSSYPIHYKYGRHNAGVGKMFDTRDFVNHNLDSRSNDYTPRAVPDPSTIGGLKVAMGHPPVNPNGTRNVYNPPVVLRGLPPQQKSDYYFMQYY